MNNFDHHVIAEIRKNGGSMVKFIPLIATFSICIATNTIANEGDHSELSNITKLCLKNDIYRFNCSDSSILKDVFKTYVKRDERGACLFDTDGYIDLHWYSLRNYNKDNFIICTKYNECFQCPISKIDHAHSNSNVLNFPVSVKGEDASHSNYSFQEKAVITAFAAPF